MAQPQAPSVQRHSYQPECPKGLEDPSFHEAAGFPHSKPVKLTLYCIASKDFYLQLVTNGDDLC